MHYRTEDLARWGVGNGANLTPVEIDANFWELAERLAAAEAAAGDAVNGIANIGVVGSQMTVYLEDGTALGPYTLPTAMIRYRGDWTASTAYSELDLVTVPSAGVYLVLQDHSSDATAFDALAEDAEGNPLYRFLFPMGNAGVSVADLTDVDLVSEPPVTGQTLVFFNDTWYPGLPSMRLNDLEQVFPGTPTDGQVLTWVAADAAWRSRNPARPSVSDEAAQILASPTDINFAGAGVTVADDGDGTVTVTIPGGGGGGGAAVSDEGAEVLAAPTDVNYVGAGVSVADDGDGTVTVTIPGGGATGVSDEGAQILAGPSDLNFAGAGVTVADDGDGSVTITIPGGGGGASALDDLSDVTITGPAAGQFLRYDGSAFVNAVVDWSDLANKPATFAPAAHTHPIGELQITGTPDGTRFLRDDGTWALPAGGGGSGAAVSDEGAQVLAAPADINFAGAGVSVANDGDGSVTVTIPGVAAGPPVGEHAYWRISIANTASNTNSLVNEIRFRLNGANHALLGTAIASAFGHPVNAPSAAVDGNDTTVWASGTAPPHWLGYQFNTPVAVDAVRLKAGDTTTRVNGMPTVFSVAYSDDGITWTTVGDTILTSWSTLLEEKTFGVPTTSDAEFGDMTKSVYDPQARNADAFARANHTGDLPLSALAVPGALEAGVLVQGTVRDIWRADTSRSPMPRTATISSIAGDVITFTAALNEYFGRWDVLAGNVYVRVWNTSKNPDQAAWVKASPSGTQLQVTNSAHIAGWSAGEVVQIGDPNPTGTNTLLMAAIDISPYLIAEFGMAFRQKGVVINCRAEATGGVGSVTWSASGAGGTALPAVSLSTGGYNNSTLLIPSSELSPISNSNLIFFREVLDGGTACLINLCRICGIVV